MLRAVPRIQDSEKQNVLVEISNVNYRNKGLCISNFKLFYGSENLDADIIELTTLRVELAHSTIDLAFFFFFFFPLI